VSEAAVAAASMARSVTSLAYRRVSPRGRVSSKRHIRRTALRIARGMRRRRDRAIAEEDMRRRVRTNVRARREAESLTLKQVALRVKRHPRHWQKGEAGTVNLTLLTLVRVGVALGVDPVKLL
jgi:ribosome-binding protein aMBF1 (putative translation factor)